MRGWLLLLLALCGGSRRGPRMPTRSSATSSTRRASRISTTSTPRRPRAASCGWCRRSRSTNFDKFNPFTLKGTAPAGMGQPDVREPADRQFAKSRPRPTACWPRTWRSRPTGSRATFRLRPEARFNDGTPVLAADVAYSFDTLIGTLAAPQFRTIYAEVKGASGRRTSAPCASTSSPNRELPLVVGGMPVFSRDWGGGKPFDQVMNELPIGSGPYKIVDARAWAATSPTCATRTTGAPTCRCAGAVQLRPRHLQDLPRRDRALRRPQGRRVRLHARVHLAQLGAAVQGQAVRHAASS